MFGYCVYTAGRTHAVRSGLPGAVGTVPASPDSCGPRIRVRSSARPSQGFENPLRLSKDGGGGCLQDLPRLGLDLYLPNPEGRGVAGGHFGEGGLGKLTAPARKEGSGAKGAAELRPARE